MSWTQKFSFSRDPVILDLKLQLAGSRPSPIFNSLDLKTSKNLILVELIILDDLEPRKKTQVVKI
jgi:hypothetical protein